MKPIELDAEARTELLRAVAWYGERSVEVGRRFVAAVEATTAEVQRWLRRFPVLNEPTTDPPVRRARVKRFPFAIIFVELRETIRIIAVAHQRRRPLYWASRVPKV
mgnify:FL=1